MRSPKIFKFFTFYGEISFSLTQGKKLYKRISYAKIIQCQVGSGEYLELLTTQIQ